MEREVGLGNAKVFWWLHKAKYQGNAKVCWGFYKAKYNGNAKGFEHFTKQITKEPLRVLGVNKAEYKWITRVFIVLQTKIQRKYSFPMILQSKIQMEC